VHAEFAPFIAAFFAVFAINIATIFFIIFILLSFLFCPCIVFLGLENEYARLSQEYKPDFGKYNWTTVTASTICTYKTVL
jgi:hypothetical protein